MLLSLTEFIGRFHPVLVHLPIGILLLAVTLQLLSHKKGYALPPAALKVVWLGGAFSALLSCITGYLLSASGEYDSVTVAVHMWLALLLMAVSFLLCAKIFQSKFGVTYKAALIGLLVLLLLTGHFGGSLTHGADYLTAALHGDAGATALPQKPIANVQEATAYADVVQPILQAHCYGCHGPQKQKGGLRMDDVQALLKGGKNGKALLPGNAGESEMLKRILLPREDEDHMPPKEKPQLTERQIALLHWWIDGGAYFTKKVKDIAQNEKTGPLLLALQSPQAEKPVSLLPAEPVVAADAADIAALTKRGVVVMVMAQNTNYLSANFVAASSFSDADVRLLLPLKRQLAEIKLGTTKITDEALKVLGQCTNLRVLQLNGTKIADAGLLQLRGLDSLRTLNLVGTNVSTQGLLSLRPLKNLQALYVYQTAIHGADWLRLKQAFPKTQIDTGGYAVPFFATDTTVVKPPEKK